jgi:hypothetical protein
MSGALERCRCAQACIRGAPFQTDPPPSGDSQFFIRLDVCGSYVTRSIRHRLISSRTLVVVHMEFADQFMNRVVKQLDSR